MTLADAIPIITLGSVFYYYRLIIKKKLTTDRIVFPFFSKISHADHISLHRKHLAPHFFCKMCGFCLSRYIELQKTTLAQKITGITDKQSHYAKEQDSKNTKINLRQSWL